VTAATAATVLRFPPSPTRDAAEQLHGLSYNVVALDPETKHPGYGWKKYQTEREPWQTLRWRWYTDPTAGIGIICGVVSDLTVLDLDRHQEPGEPDDTAAQARFDAALGKIKELLPPGFITPCYWTRSRGLQVWVRHVEGLKNASLKRHYGLAIDVKTQGGLVVVPPTAGRVWCRGCSPWDVAVAAAPPALLAWLREVAGADSEPEGRPREGDGAAPWSDKLSDLLTSRERADAFVFTRARRYLARNPAAISGQGGHTTTFIVACKLVHGFRLGLADARELIREWNERCQPQWSDDELDRKLDEAARHGSYRSLIDEVRK
jgi:hypothetical protein